MTERNFIRLRNAWNRAYRTLCEANHKVEKAREAWCQHPGPKRSMAHLGAVAAQKAANAAYAEISFVYVGCYGGTR